ncbi:MAG: hypothetical protein Kow0029_10340 [Candidatus Rifleibacteriota bacterium]
MKNFFVFLFVAGLLVLPAFNFAKADDLTFNSFEEAEAAAKKRAEEYNKRMNEHMQKIQSDWEKQQKDLGESGASPDITKITSSSDGQKTSDTEASKNLEDAVNSSVNRLKDTMISQAGPNTTGFAGGGAGYQWSIKFKNGKYVLSDSYNEAAFGTGDKRDTPPEPASPAAEGSDSDEDSKTAVASKPTSSEVPPSDEPSSPGASADSSSSSSDPAGTSVASAHPDATTGDAEETAKPATTAPAPEPAKPGIDPAPTKLPEPAVRMVIQHPTEFTEEVFSCNSDSEETQNYTLDKFKIPEDTRVKIALEFSKEVDPNKFTLVMTDEEGERPPVSSNRLKNYRHMFRVPSEDKYSAKVVMDDGDGKGKRELMIVKIPVVKVDFDSRTIDNQRAGKGSDNSGSGSATSYFGSDSNYSHSTFGKPQQIDLSDLYTEAGDSATGDGSDSTAGSHSSSNTSGEGSSSGDASGSTENENNSSGSSDYSSAGNDGSNVSNPDSNFYASADVSGGNADNSSAAYTDTEDENFETNSYSADDRSSHASSGSSRHNASFASRSSGTTGSFSSSGSQEGSVTTSDQEYTNDNSIAGTDAETSASRKNYAAESNSSGNTDSPDSNLVDSASETDADMVGADNEQEQDPFIMALSMQAVSRKIYQSFDFIDEKAPVSANIPAGTEVTFSMTFDSSVDPQSVKIELYNGKDTVHGDLKTWGEAFAYVFDVPQNCYILVSGKSEKGNFSYKLTIPVK